MKYDLMKRELNVKNMKETLVNYCGGDYEEFNNIWESFRCMKLLGFISDRAWNKFFDETHLWRIEGDYLVDDKNGEVIFDFNNGARNNGEYKEYVA